MVLRVKLEIVPFGDEERTREIGRLDIFNKGEAYSFPGRVDGARYCEYGVISLCPDDSGLFDATLVHRRDDGAWALVRSVLTTFNIRGPK